jgi:hypothetical protein
MAFHLPPVSIAPRFGFRVGFGCNLNSIAFTICIGRCENGQLWPFYRAWMLTRHPWPNGRRLTVLRNR